MPVVVGLHASIERVFVYTFSDPWTWDELMFGFEDERRYSASLPPGVVYCTLILIYEARGMAPGLSLAHFAYMQRHDPPNWEYMVVVRDPNRFFNPLFEAASRYPGWAGRVLLAATPAEGEQLIRDRRAPQV